MLSKEQIRKKYINIRKKKYFDTKDISLKPLIKLISTKQIKKISLYYPSNYEFNTLKLFEILKKRGRITTLLPVILKNNFMKFVNTNCIFYINKKQVENKNILSKDSKILEEQLLNLEKDILILKNTVDNKEFLKKAPTTVVQKFKNKMKQKLSLKNKILTQIKS